MKAILALLLLSSLLSAKLTVAVSYEYIRDIVENIAQDRVDVVVLSNSKMDPHHIVAKPSSIAKLRRADALIINGAQLEIGWMPALTRAANNSKLFKRGHFMKLSNHIRLMGKTDKKISRSMGHVHAHGNPHFLLDPHNVRKLAKAVTRMLIGLDSKNGRFYADNLKSYTENFKKKLKIWDEKMKRIKYRAPLEHHALFSYFFRRYGIESAGTLEPVPGVTPTPKHLMGLIEKVKNGEADSIVQSPYNYKNAANFLISKVSIPLLILPHDVRAVDGVESIEQMFDYIVKRLSVDD